MKIYTSIKSIPELYDLPDNWRNDFWRNYGFIALFHWKTLLTFVLCSPILLGSIKLSCYLEERFPDINGHYFIYMPLHMISFLIVSFILFQVTVRVVRPYVAEDRAEFEESNNHQIT